MNKGSAAGGAVDVDIDPSISPVQQPSTMTCWAAVGTMMLSWREGVSQTIEAALDSLGGDWRAKFDANSGLTPGELHRVPHRPRAHRRASAGLPAVGHRRAAPEPWASVGHQRQRHRRRPDSPRPHRDRHPRRRSPDGTTVTVVDPATGTTGTETFARFSDLLEAGDAVDVATGIADSSAGEGAPFSADLPGGGFDIESTDAAGPTSGVIVVQRPP